MSIRYAIIATLLAFLFIAGSSLAQDASSDLNSSSSVTENVAADNATAPESVASEAPSDASVDDASGSSEEETASDEEAASDETTASKETAASDEAAEPINLQYIWSVTGIENDQITMVLNQNGTELYGQAKYEPEDGDPWNAVAAGSISGEKVNLVMTIPKGNDIVSTSMAGTYSTDDQTISGKFSQMAGGKVSKRGDFSAQWINPTISDYTPAKITEAKPAASKSTTTDLKSSSSSETTSTSSEASAVTAGQASQSSQEDSSLLSAKPKSKYVDVHEYADKIGPGGDLSGVPPGMGGSMGV